MTENGKIEKVAKDDWLKDPDKVIRRVFRQFEWWKNPSKKKLGLANLEKRQIKGTDYPALTVISTPNHACQHVLEANVREYAVQLKALRGYVEKGLLEEIDPSEAGKVGIPPHIPTELEKQNKTLVEKVKDLEAKLAGKPETSSKDGATDGEKSDKNVTSKPSK